MAKTAAETARDRDAKGPSMSRSQAQIAMSYAPGQHFTFEGAAGACQAMPSPNAAAARLDQTTKTQIEMRIDEAARAWFDKAITCRRDDNSAPAPFPDFCIDVSLLDTTRSQYVFRPHAFAYLRPDRMGYLPRPTTLICSECGLIEAFDSPRQMGQRLSELSRACPHPKRSGDAANCSWGQLDVIFAHWSGSWKSASPNMTVYDQTTRRPIKTVCCLRQMRQSPVRPEQGSSRLVKLVVLMRELRNKEPGSLGREMRRNTISHRGNGWARREYRRRSVDGEDQLRSVVSLFREIRYVHHLS
jgi:hypothetical protein